MVNIVWRTLSKFHWILFVEVHLRKDQSWWRHQMETFSALLAICAGNSPVPGDFPAQRPVTRSFDVFFDLRPNKRLCKQTWGWWFETPTNRRSYFTCYFCHCGLRMQSYNFPSVDMINSEFYDAYKHIGELYLMCMIYICDIRPFCVNS